MFKMVWIFLSLCVLSYGYVDKEKDVAKIKSNPSINYEASKTVIATKHNANLTLGQIAEIQAGLGTLMVEFGHRFYVAYYAAKAKNWELVKYEIHELIEAQEVAEVTRPKYTEQLKAFEHGTLAKLQQTIQAKDWKQFEVQYAQTTKACNACHTKNGHPYIQYQLPKEAPKYLRMELLK